MLYAMFGNSINGVVNTIESLNVRKLLNGDNVNWCEFQLATGEISPRFVSLVSPISSNEIAILGGKNFDS